MTKLTKLITLLLAIAFILFGCGGGSSVSASHAPVPPVGSGNAPAPPPVPPVPPTPPPDPTPPPPPDPAPPPPPAPTPIVVGSGGNVMLSIVDNQPVIAYQSAGSTHVGAQIYPGALADFEAGVVLTYTFDDTHGSTSIFINGQPLTTEIGQQIPIIIDGDNAAWPIGTEVLLAASAHYEATVDEPNDGACHIAVNGIEVAADTLGCADTLKLIEVGSTVYVGWSDGQGVTIEQSQDQGQTWQVAFTFGGKQGVFGADYAIRTDGTIIAAWTEYVPGESGSAVYSGGSEATRRLSGVVPTGYSGAGNPSVAADGSITYLDDRNGSAAGHFDVYLDGVDLTNTDDAIDEGPRLGLLSDGTRVVAWDDDVTVWMEEVPAP